ncbi:hypothetical protein A6R68_00106, partial [Neotoma lepida]
MEGYIVSKSGGNDMQGFSKRQGQSWMYCSEEIRHKENKEKAAEYAKLLTKRMEEAKENARNQLPR